MASTAVYLTGSLLTLGGLGVLLGFYVEWALVLLVIFLVPVSFMMHAFWKVADAQAKNDGQNSISKIWHCSARF